jgi:hypothetical protein
MPKLTGAKKAAFLARMAKGRRKAERAAPAAKKRPAAPKKKRPAAKKKPNPKPKHKLKMLTRAASKRIARPKPNPRRRRNSDDESMDAASRQFEAFHGKAPERIIEIEQAYRYPGTFAELGHLKELRFDLNSRNRDFPLTGFGKACQVVCTPDGSNIYFIGGDQSIDFEALDIASDKDFVDLGPCGYISYHTVKGFHDFQPTTYWHRFGEEDKIRPSLTYDRLNKTLFLVSGNYRVRPEGIVN